MKQRIKDAILLEMSFFSPEDKCAKLFHTNRQMLEMAIEQLEFKNPCLADVLRPISKLATEYRFDRGAKFEMILRLIELEAFVEKSLKFV